MFPNSLYKASINLIQRPNTLKEKKIKDECYDYRCKNVQWNTNKLNYNNV